MTTEPLHAPASAAVLAARTSLQGAIDPPADGLTAAADLHELLAMQAEIAAAVAARLRTVDTTQTWQQTGSKAQWAWLARHSHTDSAAPMSAGTARQWVRVSQELPRRGRVDDGLRGGRLSPRHVDVLLAALTELDRVVAGTAWNTADWLAAQERAFCDLAELTDHVTLQRELRKRLQALAPEPAADDARDQVADRSASLTPGLDGAWNLTGTLDPDSGELLHTALTAWRRTDRVADDTRTPAQRDVDAIVGMARAWLERGDTVSRGTAPHLVVTVPEARLAAHQSLRDDHGLPVRCPDSGLRLPDPFTEPLFTRDGVLLAQQEVDELIADHGAADACDVMDTVPPATYADGSAVAESTLDQLLCNATLTRMVLDADGHVLDVGRTSRVFTWPQWLAAMRTWGGRCATDGCAAPPGRVELHHAVWWRDGGTTDLDNCVPLCHGSASCHTRVHDGQALRLRDGRLLDRTGFRPADLDAATVWPPPLAKRPPRERRAAAAALGRLDRLLVRPAA